MRNVENFTGISDLGIIDALQNALIKAGNPAHFEIIETLGSHDKRAIRQYQVVLKTITE